MDEDTKILEYHRVLELMKRKEIWRKRVGGHLKKTSSQCLSCQRYSYCDRLYVNEMIRMMFLSGENCPDYLSIWNRILEIKR